MRLLYSCIPMEYENIFKSRSLSSWTILSLRIVSRCNGVGYKTEGVSLLGGLREKALSFADNHLMPSSYFSTHAFIYHHTESTLFVFSSTCSFFSKFLILLPSTKSFHNKQNIYQPWNVEWESHPLVPLCRCTSLSLEEEVPWLMPSQTTGGILG